MLTQVLKLKNWQKRIGSKVVKQQKVSYAVGGS